MEAQNSPEAVALELVRILAYCEGYSLFESDTGGKPDRKWLLDTYDACLKTTKGSRNQGGGR
jgi:hypothetical protein